MRIFLVSLLMMLSLPSMAQSTAFINVNVVPMTGEQVIPAQTVVVRGQRIVEIGRVDSTPLPDDAAIVDGTDRYLLPGLTEMHGHVTGTSDDELDRLFGLYIANGVTTVRGMLGRPEHLELRRRLAAHEILGPRLVTSGPSLNGNSVDDPAHGAALVRAQHAAGYDFVKIHPGLTRTEFQAIAIAANELGMPFAGHVPEDAGIAVALALGMATIDHLDGYMETLIPADRDPTGGIGGFFGLRLARYADDGRLPTIAAETARAGVWNVPTQTLFEHFVNAVPAAELVRRPEMRYVPAGTLADWAEAKRQLHQERGFDAAVAERAILLRRALILALHRAGAGLLLGSDSPQRFNVPGFSLHRELELYVESGLTPYEALLTGTVNPAAFFGTEAEAGTIEVGKVADILLLDENPLEDIRNSRRVHGTMVRGRWVSRPELDALLARIERD